MLNGLGLAAATSFVLGPVLAWLRLVPPLGGFALFALGGVIALFVSVIALARALRGRGFNRGGLAALVTAVVFVAAASRGVGHPRINDFTTDLADPPAFGHAGTLHANVGRDLSYPPTYAAVQQACCADLHAARLPLPPTDALARARQAAANMPGWTVTQVDPGAGTVEAIATSGLFGFVDDIVIRVRPDGAAGSRVDVRSKSRNGQGDLGANAARIRAYVAVLEGATNAAP